MLKHLSEKVFKNILFEGPSFILTLLDFFPTKKTSDTHLGPPERVKAPRDFRRVSPRGRKVQSAADVNPSFPDPTAHRRRQLGGMNFIHQFLHQNQSLSLAPPIFSCF